MIRLKGTAHPNTASFLAAAVRVAEYYGFEPLETMPRAKGVARKQLPSGARPDSEILFARKDERALPSAARRLLSIEPEPLRAILAWRVTSVPSNNSVSFELHAAGILSSIAEALLIVAAHAIIKEAASPDGQNLAGGAGRVLSINNMGSPESCGRFVRDVGSYLRKHLESISPVLRPRVATDPLGTLVQLIEKGHPAISRAPQAMEYLTEEERQRFWDLLEYLEEAGLPYELNTQILGSRDCWMHALYEIAAVEREIGTRTPVAFGGRYDTLMSRFARVPYPAAMVAISCEVRGSARVKPQARGIPAMYFAHLGIEARRRALPMIEGLRVAGIPVYHGLWHERIGDQIAAARMLATPYILIMGHKEAVEGTVLVREVATNSQEAVPVPELAPFLKRHRLTGAFATKAGV